MQIDDAVVGIIAEGERGLSPEVRDVIDLVALLRKEIVEAAVLGTVKMLFNKNGDLALAGWHEWDSPGGQHFSISAQEINGVKRM